MLKVEATTPSNMVTTDTTQSVSGAKTFTTAVVITASSAAGTRSIYAVDNNTLGFGGNVRFENQLVSTNLKGGTTGTDVLHIYSVQSDGAAAKGVRLDTEAAYANATSQITTFANGNTDKSGIGKNGQFRAPTGNADSVVGTATLSGGTVTVNTTAISATSKIFVSRNTVGGTLGHLSHPDASIVAATSFVINSSSGTDTSTVNWWIVN